MEEIKNKKLTAVITGAGGGIGRATALRLVKEGIKVILLGGNRVQKLSETEALIKNAEGECEIYPGNLTDFNFLFDAAEKIARENNVDILINNAGVAMNATFTEVTEKQFDDIMNINVRVPYFLTQKLLPYIKKSEHATIINIASVVSHAGYPLQSAYVASKHALLGFTKSLAAEVYKDGVRVHAISPGGVYTDMVKISRPDLSEKGMILPENIADIVWFFISNRGNAVIDEILVHRVGKEPFLV